MRNPCGHWGKLLKYSESRCKDPKVVCSSKNQKRRVWGKEIGDGDRPGH